MSNWTTTAALALCCVAALLIGRRALERRTSHPLPPGPPGLPWFGNVIGIDSAAPYKTYAKWSKKYGDIMHVRLMGKDLIVINSEKIANDLLDKRSRNYSDRPYFITTDLCGIQLFSSRLPYGDQWRLHRRFFHQTFRLDAASRFWPLLHNKTCQFLRRFLDNPEHLNDNVFEYTTSVIMNSTYDYDPASRQDELVDTVVKTLNIVLLAARSDVSILAGAFEILLRLTSWMPGMSFNRRMADAREATKVYIQRPFEYSVKKEASGSPIASMVHDALRLQEQKGITPEKSWMEELKWATGTSFLAASATSNAVLMTFFMMMVLHPEVQDKAYAEIEAVVGKDRLPATDDRALLPYVQAVMWEALRCHPVAPLSAPHSTVDEDIYNGYYIPKGAIVLANAWSMANDESRFPNPQAFTPERFFNDDGSLKPNETDHITYGFGRRICVGKYFADWSVWTVIAKVLAVYKVVKALDENGVEIPVEAKWSQEGINRPLPFKFKIVPRHPGMDSKELEQLIAASAP